MAKKKRPRVRKRREDAGSQLVIAFCRLKGNKKKAGTDAWDRLRRRFEVKTTTTKYTVSTGRDVTSVTVNRWRIHYWLISFGHTDDDGEFVMDDLYITHPINLEPRFAKRERDMLPKGWRKKAIRTCERHPEEWLPEEIEALKEDLKHKLNDPKIPKSFVRENCTKLDISDQDSVATQIEEYCIGHPLGRTAKQKGKRKNDMMCSAG